MFHVEINDSFSFSFLERKRVKTNLSFFKSYIESTPKWIWFGHLYKNQCETRYVIVHLVS